VVYQFVCNLLLLEMRAKRLYLRPSYLIGLDWIFIDMLLILQYFHIKDAAFKLILLCTEQHVISIK